MRTPSPARPPAVGLRRPVDVPERHPPRPGELAGVDRDPAQAGQVERQAALARAVPATWWPPPLTLSSSPVAREATTQRRRGPRPAAGPARGPGRPPFQTATASSHPASPAAAAAPDPRLQAGELRRGQPDPPPPGRRRRRCRWWSCTCPPEVERPSVRPARRPANVRPVRSAFGVMPAEARTRRGAPPTHPDDDLSRRPAEPPAPPRPHLRAGPVACPRLPRATSGRGPRARTTARSSG